MVARRWAGTPLGLMLLGFLASALGVATTYVFPATRAPGVNPTSIALCVVVFGGMFVMLIGADMTTGETEAEQRTIFRRSVRLYATGVVLLATFSAVNLPFAIVATLLLTRRAAEWLRRVCVWLGRP